MTATSHPPDSQPGNPLIPRSPSLVQFPRTQDLNALHTPAFVLKNELHAIGTDAVLRGAITHTISVARGDPNYPSPFIAQDVFTALTGRARLISEYGSARGIQIFETLWTTNDPTISGGFRGDVVFHAVKRFLNEMMKAGKALGLSQDDVEQALYKQILGEQYDDPKGLLLARAILTRYLNEEVFGLNRDVKIALQHLIITEGAGAAIGTFLTMCRASRFLQPGDKVVLLSPLYEPYAVVCHEHGLQVLALDCSGPGGQPTDEGRAWLQDQSFKLLIIVDPSNPTGNTLNTESNTWLASLAERKGAIVLVDAVYSELLDEPTKRTTIMQTLPAQTVVVWSFSKSHCQTGSRMGGIAYSEAAATWLRARLSLNEDLDEALCTAKCLAGAALKHVCMLPTPQQIRAAVLATCSGDHLRDWRNELRARYTLMHDELDLEMPEGVGTVIVPYYMTLSLEDLIARWAASEPSYKPLLTGMRSGLVTEDDLLAQLAESGVELLYCARFFPGAEHEHRWFVRISVANQHQRELREVAQIMRRTFLQLSSRIAEEQAEQ